jgi:DNA polymerase I-like protein with 3'-5' exonuclease and polymerase domains
LDLVKRIESVDFLVCHNAKYELGWLSRCGVDTSSLLVFDTKIAEYVLLGNLAAGDPDTGVRRVSTSLDDCCIRRGFKPKDPIVDMWMKNGIRVDMMPRKWVEDRCKQDVESTRTLFLDQRTRLLNSNRLGVLYTRCLLTPVLSAIEQEGMHLDKDRVSATHAAYSEQLAGLEREFHEVAGGINWRSPPQVAAYLYDTLGFPEPRGRDGKPKRTATGRRLASKKSIAGLRPSTDAQRRFIALRSAIGKVGFALSKSLDYFKEVCNGSGTFTAEFNQTVTSTHRLSSSGIRSDSGKSVQFQNLQRDFKCLFSARRDGWLVGEADGAQLEFRVATFLGDDAQARKDIADPEWDAHCVTAAAMLQKPYEEVYAAYKAGEKWAKDARQDAKTETFKPLYGGSKGTKAQERWYEEFKQRYPDLAAKQQDWVYEVLRTKRLVTPWGLRYYWPHAKMSDSGYCNVGSAVYNYPVQALATAEIIPMALTYLWHRIKGEGLERDIVLVNTVHDSVVAEINPEHADDFRRLARLAFGPDVHNYLLTVYGMDFDVPLGTGIKIGTHWGEGPEEKYEYLRQESK